MSVLQAPYGDTGGRAVLETLRAYGIDTVFGIPGTHNLELYRPLPELGIRAVTTRHEQGAGYAADGWSLQTGKPGVVITTSGPGLLNALSAAGTAYSTHGVNTIPFYIYYAMFGFQRIGDLAWAAADARARGFLLGATAGRTTINGEGLQHEDGHSPLVAMTIPTCRFYDPAYAYELAVIIEEVDRHGGLVNKFEGDATLAIFGAPAVLESPEEQALAATRTIARRLKIEVPECPARIGVASGEVVAGNVGARERFEYTVIGEPVNEAARLAELARSEPSRALASAAMSSPRASRIWRRSGSTNAAPSTSR